LAYIFQALFPEVSTPEIYIAKSSINLSDLLLEKRKVCEMGIASLVTSLDSKDSK